MRVSYCLNQKNIFREFKWLSPKGVGRGGGGVGGSCWFCKAGCWSDVNVEGPTNPIPTS